MKDGSTLADYRVFVASLIRKTEVSRAHGDKARLEQIESYSDDYLLKRWLWTFAIVGGPITFIAIPVLLSGLAAALPDKIMDPLWFLSKGAMGIIFFMFVVAVLTSKAKQ